MFRFAGASDDEIGDPTPMLRGALKTPARSRHHAALKRADIGPFLRTVEAYDGEATTRLAIQMILHTVVRTSELIEARLTEFEARDNPEQALWRIPAERMKMRTEHLVPLTPATLALLDDLQQITGEQTICSQLRMDDAAT